MKMRMKVKALHLRSFLRWKRYSALMDRMEGPSLMPIQFQMVCRMMTLK